ncbi:G2/mitotic-specific cyclin-B3 [Scyliorhinus canicula]|uniref:G2/mitotic-specific cyclin-B3 n=1 Tax=Scyliorhinus canicula TaxID=7830 RepID=UPI0018F7C85E|nr:G2/mitotic-specific cyclin-B3 [Scyliorhinus canicula]XP_038631362.1 G2/mitotic-specific cyclin-B3 [Scyliorhinus canicula]
MPQPTETKISQRGSFRKEPSVIEKDDGLYIKRSPSSPQGGPKKRSAFEDLTNAKQGQDLVSKKKGGKSVGKKTLKSTAGKETSKNDENNLKRTGPKDSQEQQDNAVEEKKPEKQDNAGEPKEPASPEEKIADVDKSVGIKLSAYDDVDEENLNDPFLNAIYANDIFSYMKEREEKFVLKGYMQKQPDLNIEMRAILVDWMVEVQENFELNHETLYLAVKLVDHYLAMTVCMRETLQLLGSTAFLIAAKFDERCPPCVDDFLYICDDAYQREELLSMEMNILRTLKFDINIPVAYRFLRRYAKCARANLETLTLARYICELTLQEYEFIWESASKLAASCLLLALKMKELGGWTPTLEHYTGYPVTDLHSLTRRLNLLLCSKPDEKMKAVRYKYAHNVFFEVAKIPPMDVLKLEEQLKLDT